MFHNVAMATLDPRIDTYIANAAPFAQPILIRARELVHAATDEIDETLKWGMPTFMYRGKILCGLAAFKQHASFGFWQHALVLGEAREDGEGMGSFGKMTSVKDLPSKTRLLPLLHRAMKLIEDGTPSPVARKKGMTKPPPQTPPDLLAALKKNAAARKTYDRFPPSKQREYADWISEAKREETRAKRLAQALEWLAEGKARHWKYENC